jgi:hypothetical protein
MQKSKSASRDGFRTGSKTAQGHVEMRKMIMDVRKRLADE